MCEYPITSEFTRFEISHEEAMELFPIVSVRYENRIILNLIAEAIMREKLNGNS